MMFREVEVIKRDGPISAEEYSTLCKHAMRHSSEVWLEVRRTRVNAKSVMGVLSMGLRDGDRITVVVKGEDEEDALEDICHLVHGAWKKAI